jgi:hypothetical protein
MVFKEKSPLKIESLALTFDKSKLQRWIAPFWNQCKILDFVIPLLTYLKAKNLKKYKC